MSVKESHPIQPVRVFVGFEALAELEPPNIQDPAAAFDHFDKFRARIESAASENFDRNGLDAEKYEGMQIIRLSIDDAI